MRKNFLRLALVACVGHGRETPACWEAPEGAGLWKGGGLSLRGQEGIPGSEPAPAAVGWTTALLARDTPAPWWGQVPPPCSPSREGRGEEEASDPAPPPRSPCAQGSELRGLSFLTRSALPRLPSLRLGGLLSSGPQPPVPAYGSFPPRPHPSIFCIPHQCPSPDQYPLP